MSNFGEKWQNLEECTLLFSKKIDCCLTLTDKRLRHEKTEKINRPIIYTMEELQNFVQKL